MMDEFQVLKELLEAEMVPTVGLNCLSLNTCPDVTFLQYMSLPVSCRSHGSNDISLGTTTSIYETHLPPETTGRK